MEYDEEAEVVNGEVVEDDPAPEPTEPETESVSIPCAGCGTVYTFDVRSDAVRFKASCRRCGTSTEWYR